MVISDGSVLCGRYNSRDVIWRVHAAGEEVRVWLGHQAETAEIFKKACLDGGVPKAAQYQGHRSHAEFVRSSPAYKRGGVQDGLGAGHAHSFAVKFAEKPIGRGRFCCCYYEPNENDANQVHAVTCQRANIGTLHCTLLIVG